MKKIIVVLLVLSFMWSCKGNEDIPNPESQAKILSFIATPATIDLGASSKLSWSVSGVTVARLDNNIGAVPANGEMSVSPKVITVYILSAGEGTNIVTASVTVTIKGTPPPPPPPPPGHAEIRVFQASNYNVAAYETVRVEWEVINAVAVKYCNGNANSVGSESRTFSNTTTVFIDAVGTDNQWVSKSLTINVDLRQACSWFGAGSYGWTYPDKNTCRVTTNKNGSPYYSARNLTFTIILYNSSNVVIDSGTGVIPVIGPGTTGSVDIYLPNGKGGLADHVSMSLTRCDCDYGK